MRTIERDIVAAVIFSKDQKIFFGMKDPKKGGVYPDCWHIPGGGMEEGEDQKDTLFRELKEEIGLDVSPYKIELIDDIGEGSSEKTLKKTGERVIAKMRFFVYRIDIDDKNSEEIKITLGDDEFVKYKWALISELKTLKLNGPSTELFTRLGYL